MKGEIVLTLLPDSTNFSNPLSKSIYNENLLFVHNCKYAGGRWLEGPEAAPFFAWRFRQQSTSRAMENGQAHHNAPTSNKESHFSHTRIFGCRRDAISGASTSPQHPCRGGFHSETNSRSPLQSSRHSQSWRGESGTRLR